MKTKKKYKFTHPSEYAVELVEKDFFNVQSFSELCEKISNLPHSWQEGVAFEVWVEAYLNVICEMVKSFVHSSKISQEDRIDWVNHTGIKNEKGFDAFIWFFNDPIPMPVQIKYRTGRNQINYGELGTFGLATKKFDYGRMWIIHNTEKVDDQLLKESYISTGGNEFHELDPDDLQRMNKWLKGTLIKNLKKEMEFRDYQDEECVPQVRKELTLWDRAIIHAVMASGKTVMVIKCIIDLLKIKMLKPNMNGVIMCPSRFLVGQWINPILRWIPNANILPVCTQEEITSEEANHLAITDIEKISHWTKENEDNGPSFFLVTPNSYPKLVQGLKLAGVDKLDFGCADECHNYTGRITERKTFFFQNSVFEIDKRLAVSGSFMIRRGSATEGTVISMDNQLYCGNVAFEYNRKRALDEGWIVGFRKYYSVNISDRDVDEDAVEFEGELYRADWISGLNACAQFVEKKDIKHCVVLHNRIPRSMLFASDGPANKSQYSAAGIKYHLKDKKVLAVRLDGHMPLSEKLAKVKQFQDAQKNGYKRAFLCLVACGLEGMDIPKIDGIWFADPKGSEKLIDQIVHRGARWLKGKKVYAIGMPLHLKSREREEIQLAARRTGYECIVNRLIEMEEEDFNGTVFGKTRGLRRPKKGYKRMKLEDLFPEITIAEDEDGENNDWLREELREALLTREWELRNPDHLQHMKMLKNLFKEEGNWEFLLAKGSGNRDHDKMPRSLRLFINNLRKLVFDEKSAYSDYLPWLKENDFPFETGPELYHKIYFMPRFRKLEKLVNDKKDWRNDPEANKYVKNWKVSLFDDHGDKHWGLKNIKMLNDLLGKEWAGDWRLLNFKRTIQEVLDNPNSPRSKSRLNRWGSKREKYEKDLVVEGKAKFDLVDELLKKLGKEWPKPASPHKWTKEEEKILKDNYATKTDQTLSLTMLKGIPAKKIADKRLHLGLIKTAEMKKEGIKGNNLSEVIISEEKAIKKVRAFYKENGNSLGNGRSGVHGGVKMPQDVKTFLSNQRYIKAGKKRVSTDGKVLESTEKALNEMGFVWDPQSEFIMPIINSGTYRKKQSGRWAEYPMYHFSIILEGKSKSYRRTTLKNAEEALAKMIETGRHLEKNDCARNAANWSNDEIKIIKDNWEAKSDEEIQKLMPRRNIRAIANQRQKLGLIKRVALIDWSNDEVKIIKDNHQKMTDTELSKSLLPNKTRKQITEKRLRMGLKKK